MPEKHELPTLYKRTSKGKVQQNKIIVFDRGVEAAIKTFRGYTDGKITCDEPTLITEGKNIGKANETSILEQAMLEAKSKWNKKRDEGYCLSIEETMNNVVILPMLASKYKDQKKHIKFPAFLQRKFDGTRCLISKKQDGSVSLMTRGGKEFPGLNHIRDAIKDVLEVGQFIDGELYSHEITFQEIVGLVKRETPKPGDEQKVKLIGVRAYDCFKIGTDEDFETRYSVLEKLISGIDKFELVENIEVFSDAEIMPLHDKFVLEGYEGAIIRNKKGFYELDNRSKNLQKIKVFDDAEFEVVGYKEGSGNETGCVVWRCKTKEDKEFDCRPRGIRSQRMDWFENGEKYIGKMLTVRYFGFTDDNKPRHPVGIIFRDYED